MKELNGLSNYNAEEEIKNLCDAISSLPGIEIICTSYNYGIHLWFKVTDSKEGLFFLTRCVDHRYWQHGYQWEISLTVGDSYDNNYLPTHYCLNSKELIGEESRIQTNNLIENMNYHLNNENFIEDYDLDIEQFNYREIFEL